MGDGWAHPTMEDFRRQHLGEWPHLKSARIAHETWERYDSWATRQERWFKDGRHLPAPRMEPFVTKEGRVLHGFEQLFDYFVALGYEQVLDQGLEHECTPEQFRQRVKDVGRHGR